jgi:hypothetical protein
MADMAEPAVGSNPVANVNSRGLSPSKSNASKLGVVSVWAA